MSDNRATADWAAVAERWAAELEEAANTVMGQLADSRELVTALTPRAQIVAAMLMAEDDQLHHMLGNLHRRLRQWVPLNDHQVSWADGMLAGHLAADRNLAAAVADLVDLVEPQPAAQLAEQLAHRIAASMEDCMQQILDDLPLTDSRNKQLRDAIDRLCDRAQFWREHPGEAWDGQGLACVLMPIIAQLLEHREQGVPHV